MIDGNEARETLADLLWDIPHMQGDDARTSIIAELHRRISGFTIPSKASGKLLCITIIDALLEVRGGLHEMARALFWMTDGAESTGRFADYVDELLPSKFLTLRERIAYVTDLSSLVPHDELAGYYLAVANDVPARELADFDDLARELEQLVRGAQCHPLILLSEAIEQRARAPLGAHKAGRWSVRLAKLIGPDAVASLERFRASGKILAPVELGRSTIVLKLEEAGAQQDHYLFSAWLYLDNTLVEKIHGSDKAISLDGARPILRDLIDQVFARVQKENNSVPDLALEFIIPRPMLSYPFESWQTRDPKYMTLGVQFIVVVRDLERVSDPVLRGACTKKWEYLHRAGETQGGDLSAWVTCFDNISNPGQGFFRMKPETCGSAGLTFKPGDGAHPFDLEGALNAGMPIMIWPWGCDHSPTPSTNGVFRDNLSQRLNDRALRDLPEIVFEMRFAEASAGVPHGGVTLLWDDPARTPEPVDYKMAVPVSLEETR